MGATRSAIRICPHTARLANCALTWYSCATHFRKLCKASRASRNTEVCGSGMGSPGNGATHPRSGVIVCKVCVCVCVCAFVYVCVCMYVRVCPFFEQRFDVRCRWRMLHDSRTIYKRVCGSVAYLPSSDDSNECSLSLLGVDCFIAIHFHLKTIEFSACYHNFDISPGFSKFWIGHHFHTNHFFFLPKP